MSQTIVSISQRFKVISDKAKFQNNHQHVSKRLTPFQRPYRQYITPFQKVSKSSETAFNNPKCLNKSRNNFDTVSTPSQTVSTTTSSMFETVTNFTSIPTMFQICFKIHQIVSSIFQTRINSFRKQFQQCFKYVQISFIDVSQ